MSFRMSGPPKIMNVQMVLPCRFGRNSALGRALCGPPAGGPCELSSGVA